MRAVFLSFIMLAAEHKSFVYGFGEWSCNNKRCIEGVSTTASGDKLSKNIPSVAVPLPKKVPLEVTWIGLKAAEDSECIKVKVNDRTSPKLVDKRGFDLSPAALRLLVPGAGRTWSGKLYLCDPNIEENVSDENEGVENQISL